MQVTPARTARPAAYSLVEISIFLAIGAMLIVAAFEFFTGSSRILDVARRSAGSQVELQNLMETLNLDVQELVYVGSKDPFEASAGGKYRFVIRSSRAESGLPAATKSMYRRVEYEFKAADRTTLDITRSVQGLDKSGKIDAATGPLSTRVLARGLTKMKIVPMIWGPVAKQGYRLATPNDALATQDGAGVACLVVSATIGELSATKEDEKMLPTLTTKLWCRDRLVTLGWGGGP